MTETPTAGYCPACGRGDLAPTADEYEQQRQRAEHAEAELQRLRAGEEDGYDPAAYPTPGQWIARFNAASPQERLDAAGWAIGDAQRATACFYENHKAQLAERHQALVKLARVRELRDRWLLMTLEPGQVRRLLDDITHALDGETTHA